MNKGFLKRYFNKETSMEASTAIGFTAAAVVLAAAATPLSLACAAVVATVTAGYVNIWQKKATGEPFWTPRSNLLYGL